MLRHVGVMTVVSVALLAQPRPAIRPGILETKREADATVYRTAGLAILSLGGLTTNAHRDPETIADYRVRIPRVPREAERGEALPMGVIGVLTSGAVVANPMSPVSHQERGLWHLDAVGAALRGRGNTMALEELLAANDRHSPLLGYALDGYPIYGPYGWDALHRVVPMRPSYRLRAIRERRKWADGTVLAPGQEGPRVDAAAPLGLYVEDYEWAEGTGTLDVHNGRWAATPEYPNGTYAYFLALGEDGRPAYPYFVGPRFRGMVPKQRVPLGEREVELRFVVRNERGEKVRNLELVHERPMHLIIVSEDLSFFDHVHPEVDEDDEYAVRYRFPAGGRYRLYAQYTPPGGQPQVVRREQVIAGGRVAETDWLRDESREQRAKNLRVSLVVAGTPRVGAEVNLRFRIAEEHSGATVRDLTPWLGAWAHVVAIAAGGSEFLHLHPVDPTVETPVAEEEAAHTHVTISGPSPEELVAVAGFAKAGLYRLWIQFVRAGELNTVPFTLRVAEGQAPVVSAVSSLPRVLVGANGYSPARLVLSGTGAQTIEFLRTEAKGCGGELLVPELGLRVKLPVGTVVRVTVPAGAARELRFSCGMGMLRGVIQVGLIN